MTTGRTLTNSLTAFNNVPTNPSLDRRGGRNKVLLKNLDLSRFGFFFLAGWKQRKNAQLELEALAPCHIF
jgi:hypothetical protein